MAKKGALHISENSRTRASPLDAILCYIHDIHWVDFYTSAEMQPTELYGFK